jgi:hypothetical protein
MHATIVVTRHVMNRMKNKASHSPNLGASEKAETNAVRILNKNQQN